MQAAGRMGKLTAEAAPRSWQLLGSTACDVDVCPSFLVLLKLLLKSPVQPHPYLQPAVPGKHDARHIAPALLQASAHESGDLRPEKHAMLNSLHIASTNQNEYMEMVKLVRHMLHPDPSARATVAQVLQSQLFL